MVRVMYNLVKFTAFENLRNGEREVQLGKPMNAAPKTQGGRTDFELIDSGVEKLKPDLEDVYGFDNALESEQQTV